ncbi:MAG: VOC family protein [Thermoflexales bacterium]|nr:VOC family protein [Thermoflexales bacterium]
MQNFTKITTAHIWVLDHQAALDFYVGKLGFEVKADVGKGGFRWLTVGLPGEAIPEIALDVPGPPVMDEKSAAQIRELVSKGATGVVMVLHTDDCFGTYERLLARGVEFTQPATDHGYGVDCGLRDPFGNQIRILQPKAWRK